MKKQIQLFIVGIFTTTCFSQNIAFVKQDTILKILPKYTENIKTVDSLSMVYNAEIKAKTDALQVKMNTLLKPYNVKEGDSKDKILASMNELDKNKFEILLEEGKLIDKNVKSYELEIKTKFNANVQPLLDKLNKAIEKYAKTNKIDAVFIYENIRPALAYINLSKDITNEIIKALK